MSESQYCPLSNIIYQIIPRYCKGFYSTLNSECAHSAISGYKSTSAQSNDAHNWTRGQRCLQYLKHLIHFPNFPWYKTLIFPCKAWKVDPKFQFHHDTLPPLGINEMHFQLRYNHWSLEIIGTTVI